MWLGGSNNNMANMEEMYQWVENTHGVLDNRQIMLAILYTTIWALWNYLNDVAFQVKRFRKDTILDTIKLTSFNWYCFRNSKAKKDWIGWLINPVTLCTLFLLVSY